MGFSIGIVGLPNVGKSTLFKALTKQSINISNYPFCTIDPNVGIVEVPDERLKKLAEIFNPPKIVPTAIEFFDIAGLVKNAHKGEGLGNQFLSNIAEVDAIAQVVRCFENKDIIHVEGTPNPVRDIEIINLELILKDLAVVENHLQRAKKETKGNNEIATKKTLFLEKLKKHLEENKLLNSFIIDKENNETSFLKELQLLTIKPMIYILNFSLNEKEEEIEKVKKELLVVENVNDNLVVLNTKLEVEYNDLTTEEIKELELPASQITNLVKECYKILDLITFYSAGEPEVRAWTTLKGSVAPEAGTAIHTDFKTKFIRAEIINFDEFIKTESFAKAKEMGTLRIEGKDYIVQDGDIITFKI